jgi:hypothetical protein
MLRGTTVPRYHMVANWTTFQRCCSGNHRHILAAQLSKSAHYDLVLAGGSHRTIEGEEELPDPLLWKGDTGPFGPGPNVILLAG